MRYLYSFLFLVVYSGLTDAYGSSLFEISDAEFVARGQDSQERQLGTEAQLKAGEVLRLYFTVRGTAIALSALERDNSLSVVTRWWNNSTVTDQKIEVGLDNAKWQRDKNSLETQVSENGSFEWHTYAEKNNWMPGTITVSCLDQNHALAQILNTQSAEIYFKISN